MNHHERIAELRRTHKDGAVEPNIYFNSAAARFRVKMGGKWHGTFWTLEGSRNKVRQLKIDKIDEQIKLLMETKRKLEAGQ